MFDLTGKDIAALGDEDLRTLIARLCEAELSAKGLPVSGVTAGGDQNAPDGGIDVRVHLPSDVTTTDFIPRASTAFQVKVPKMPRGEILKEMKPYGSLRPVIAELAEESGAYIIVSSLDSVSDAPLRARKRAMSEAVSNYPHAHNLHLDFYDQTRIASWVRLHPGVALWLRRKLGGPLEGWQPFANWSAPQEQAETEYIFDDTCRILDGRNPNAGQLSIADGIERIRKALSKPGEAVRLIGLSGTGKTRLVQALFEDSVGKNALDPSTVLYADLGSSPDPSPDIMLSRIHLSGHEAIVVIDNCPPEKHRTLAAQCSVPGYKVRLLTVEHDIRDDTPEHTAVFRLGIASDEVIYRLLMCRAPHVSQVDMGRMVELSGGNTRIALALATTVKQGESISTLSNSELFDRLFRQRNPEDDSLKRAASICALFYSFDGETLGGDEAELPILAKLAQMNVDEMYRHIQELRQRDLVQSRGRWRAVLPQALGNHLARHALDRVHPNTLLKTLSNRSLTRLFTSFTRRLGFLHDCPNAQVIVRSWLEEGGTFSQIGSLSPERIRLFTNIAPVLPDLTLLAIENSVKEPAHKSLTDLKHPLRYEVARLLHKLAYDALFFDRAINLLSIFYMAEPPDNNTNSSRDYFLSLFCFDLSGTYAQVEQRLHFVDMLLSLGSQRGVDCGIEALGEMLKVQNSNFARFGDFGARPRDFGWRAKSEEDVQHWFGNVMEFALEKADSMPQLRGHIFQRIAQSLEEIWTFAEVYDVVEWATDLISSQQFWAPGWYQIQKTLCRGAEYLSPEALSRLKILEEKLRPKSLLDKARAYVFIDDRLFYALTDDRDKKQRETKSEQLVSFIESLGKDVAEAPEVLEKLLPELLSGHERGMRYWLGKGLAMGAENTEEMLRTLINVLASIPEGQRNISALNGFLKEVSVANPNLAEMILDEVLADSNLTTVFPQLQISHGLNIKGLDRIFTSLKQKLAPAYCYQQLAYTNERHKIPATQFRQLVDLISDLSDGVDIAINIFWMTLEVGNSSLRHDPTFIACGRDLIVRYFTFSQQGKFNHHWVDIIKTCLVDSDDITEIVCQRIIESARAYYISYFELSEIVEELFKLNPHLSLTYFILSGNEWYFNSVMERGYINQSHALNAVPLKTLLDWANQAPETRCPALASFVPLFIGDKSEEIEHVTKNALAILDIAPNKGDVLEKYEKRLAPSGWSGSLAEILKRRQKGIQRLFTHSDESVVAWAKKCDKILQDWIPKRRELERKRDRDDEERFE